MCLNDYKRENLSLISKMANKNDESLVLSRIRKQSEPKRDKKYTEWTEYGTPKPDIQVLLH